MESVIFRVMDSWLCDAGPMGVGGFKIIFLSYGILVLESLDFLLVYFSSNVTTITFMGIALTHEI